MLELEVELMKHVLELEVEEPTKDEQEGKPVLEPEVELTEESTEDEQAKEEGDSELEVEKLTADEPVKAMALEQELIVMVTVL